MKTDKDYLISAGILIIVGWFFAGIICGLIGFILVSKVKENSATKTVLAIISALEIIFCFIGIVI